MKNQYILALVLLLALAAGAAADGGEVPPALPHEFYGNVTIGGMSAPAGTVITAMIGDANCGSIRVVDAGRYGDPDRRKADRLFVEVAPDQKGATITFLANGAAAKETAAFTPGAVTRLDLTFDEVVTAPVAAFSANVTEGDAPLTVAFTDASTGAAIWSWDFGDGSTSTDRNPVHTYATPGTYTVNLTVTNKAGSSSATATITVKTPVGSITVTSVPEGATIWLDGENTGFATNATLTGIPAGEHVVTLKLDGYADASTTVTVGGGETAEVHLTLTTRTGSLAVTSVPAGAKVFIDGADTGRVTNTTVDGIWIGTHTVTLKKDGYVDAAAEIVIEEAKTATLHLDLEEVVAAPVAAFTANVTSGDAPLTVAFTDESTGAATWSWAFGDGNTSTDRNPVHTYTAAGTYTVILTATNAAGSSSATGVITVQDVPQADPKGEENFTLGDDAVTTGEGGQQVTFNATAGTGNVTGNDIHLQTGGLAVTIRTDNLTTTGNVSTGNVTGVHLESAPVNATVGSAGNVSVSFAAEMNNYNPALGITTSIYEQPGDAAKTAFVLAAQDNNLELGNVAYAVYFTKTNITGNDTIHDAVLQLTASPAWVNANGGIDAVRIFRLGDDGNRSVLETTYEGMENGMMVFRAVSPKGFSAFALAAVAGPAPAPSSSRSSSGGSTPTAVGAVSNLKAGETVTLSMRMTAVSAVTLTANGTVKDAMVTVAETSLPRGAEPPAGTVYQYVRTTLYKAAEMDLSAVQLRFAVPAAWLAEHGCTAGQVALFRHTADGWQKVPVEALDDAIFTAAPDGFGLFAIAATGEAPVPTGDATPVATGTTPVGTATTAPPAKPPVEEPSAEGLPVKMLVFITGAVVIIAAAGYLLMKRR
ncbi:PKD domain-containing protein [Methanoculleus sp. UBA303]|uniref:PKD domain-containing protein n=1 Tax=Methanoculleus sp. UBA303 TaxID=1915497 RepID=UPI0025F14F1D|nr:PKD domain-containing protein [Methanoculleus sp. UBA303]